MKDQEFETSSQDCKEVRGTYNRWSFRLRGHTWHMPYNGPANEDKLVKCFKGDPRVYIYLLDGDKRVSFWHGTTEDFKDPNPSYKFY